MSKWLPSDSRCSVHSAVDFWMSPGLSLEGLMECPNTTIHNIVISEVLVVAQGKATLLGWHSLSDATIRPRSFHAFVFVSRVVITCYMICNFWRTHVLDKQCQTSGYPWSTIKIIGGTTRPVAAADCYYIGLYHMYAPFCLGPWHTGKRPRRAEAAATRKRATTKEKQTMKR